MKILTLASLLFTSILLSTVGSPTISSPQKQIISSPQKQSHEQLGIEITSNTCSEVLYLPVGLTRGKGLIATIPVRDGGDVTAVRIMPVMQEGKIRINAMLLSGPFSETPPRRMNKLQIVQVNSLSAEAGETRVIRDDTNNSPWSVTIRAVPLREPFADSTEQPQFLKIRAQDDSKAGCGCAYCHELRVCPSRGNCIDTTCGSICCPNG
jgi:hypothetical protein